MKSEGDLQLAPLLLSVIIPNFNYAEFLARAIDSALGLDWPSVEVIVVDDGSSDGSREVMASYGDRIRAAFQSNAGQTAACNTGFAMSRGDVVIFLDSDDTLEPSLMRELSAVWRRGLSKVQFQMRVVDSSGNPLGTFLPQYHCVPTPAQIRRWARSAAAYPTPPGSGNAYAREFLEQIFPLVGEDRAADSYCLAAAPYLGDVLTIAKPLVNYRVHGRNDGAMARLDAGRFGRELQRAAARFKYGQEIAGKVGTHVSDRAFCRGLALLAYRIASLRLAPDRHPVAGDSVARVLWNTTRASVTPQGMSPFARAALSSWIVLTAISPGGLTETLVRWRFVPTSRPRMLRHALTRLRVLRSV